jgi:hypothetical protein
MPKQNRKTLRHFFEKGKLPTESNFADLVDSTLNMEDDGFSRTPENGVEIRLRGVTRRLLSFFDDPQKQKPDWAITSNPGAPNLNIARAGVTDTDALRLRELQRSPIQDYLTPLPESPSGNGSSGAIASAPAGAARTNDYQLEVRGSI